MLKGLGGSYLLVLHFFGFGKCHQVIRDLDLVGPRKNFRFETGSLGVRERCSEEFDKIHIFKDKNGLVNFMLS